MADKFNAPLVESDSDKIRKEIEKLDEIIRRQSALMVLAPYQQQHDTNTP